MIENTIFGSLNDVYSKWWNIYLKQDGTGELCVEQSFFYWRISIKFGPGKYDFYLYKWLFTE
jgi:hypothetical protein